MPTTWYIARDGKQHGPVTDVEFRRLVELGHLKASDYVWHEGAPDWLPAAQVLELALAPAAAQPEPRPVAAARPEPQPRPTAGASHEPQPQPAAAGGAGQRRREAQPAASGTVPLPQRRLVIAAAAVVVFTLIGAVSMVASDRFLGSGFFATNVDRGTVAQQLRINAPYLDDEGLNRYVTLIGDQMEAFAQRNPELCVRLLHGRSDIGDVRAYLPEALQAQEMVLLEEALLAADKSESRRRFTAAERSQIMHAILTKLSREHGDLVKLVNPETPAAGRERDACKIGTALFREIAALPGPNSAALMRSLLSMQK